MISLSFLSEVTAICFFYKGALILSLFIIIIPYVNLRLKYLSFMAFIYHIMHTGVPIFFGGARLPFFCFNIFVIYGFTSSGTTHRFFHVVYILSVRNFVQK